MRLLTTRSWSLRRPGLDYFGNNLVSDHVIPGYDSDDQDTVVDASEIRADPDSDDDDIEVIPA